MRFRLIILPTLVLLSLEGYFDFRDIPGEPLYNYNQSHIDTYKDTDWGEGSVKALIDSNIFIKQKRYNNGYMFEMGPQFHRLNNKDKQGVISRLDAFYNNGEKRNQVVFVVDCYTGKQIGAYSRQDGLILN